MQDDQFTSKSPFADVADSRERSNISMPVARAADHGAQRRQFSVRKPVQFRREQNVGDVLVAVQ